MESTDLIGLLQKTADELAAVQKVVWRCPAQSPKNPRAVRPNRNWPAIEPADSRLQKRRKNWLYGEITFPSRRNGLTLKNCTALIHISGWCPFTMWLDGDELFRESHVWNATGPIAEPVLLPVEPGRTYNLILCLEPTELPANDLQLINVGFGIRELKLLSVDLEAAALELGYASNLAGKAGNFLIEKAAAVFDTNALKARRWEDVRKSIERMESRLAPLSGKAKSRQVHLIGHCHIDMDWKWTWKDTVHCIRRDFKAIADLMDEFSELTFTHSQIPTYDVVRRMDPKVFERIRERIEEGRWEVAAGTWVEGDLNMADGESIARHMLYASVWTRKNLGTDAQVLWEPDTFGHPGNMPQLAKLGEFDCYFHMRGNPGRERNIPIRIWEGIDGTAVAAYSLIYNSTLEPRNIGNSLFQGLRVGTRNILHIWGIGDHGGGLSRYQIELLNRYRERPLVPLVRFSTMKELHRSISGENITLPRNRGETYNLFEGCFTTHAAVKKLNRQCEGSLITAETIAALSGLDRRELLREAWTMALFNQFHDILDGAAVHDSYIDAGRRGRKSLSISGKITDEALTSLFASEKRKEFLVVMNSLGFERTESVSVSLPNGSQGLLDEKGRSVPLQKGRNDSVFIARGIPAFSYRVYRLAPGAAESAVSGGVSVTETDSHFIVDTPHSTARLSKDSGCIGSYFDKSLDREFVSYGISKPLTHVSAARTESSLNVFQLLTEAPARMSAWLINSILSEENLLRNARVELVEAGPVFARFKVKHSVRDSKIDEEIMFYRDLARVDFHIAVNWKERGGPEKGVPQLKLAFGTSLSGVRARFEGPYSVAEHPADGMEQPTQKWADLSGDGFGFTLFNDSKYGCDALGGRLRMTLLRSPYEPDLDPDTGKHDMRLAFRPHGDVSQTELVRQGMSFNRPLLTRLTSSKSFRKLPSLVTDGADNVVCTSLGLAEHSNGLRLRLFEAEGKSCQMRLGYGRNVKTVREMTFRENPLGKARSARDGLVTLRFHPYEVKTVLLER